MYDKYHEDVYVIAKTVVYKVTNTSEQGLNPELLEVWAPSKTREYNESEYNASLAFCSPNLAAFSDGQGTLYVIDTSQEPWKIIYEAETCGSQRPFVVVSSLLSADEKTIQILLHYIEDKSKVENMDKAVLEKAANFVNVVDWVTLEARGPCPA